MLYTNLLEPVNIEVKDFRKELKILFFSDQHLNHTNPQSRKDDFPHAMLDKMSFIASAADSYNVDLIISGGDLFNGKTQTDKYIIELNHVLNEFKKPIYIILGNHDVYYGKSDSVYRTLCGILLSSKRIKRLGSIMYDNVGGKSVYIVGLDYKVNPVVPGLFRKFDYNVLVAHQFITGTLGDFAPEEYLKDSELEEKGYTHLLLGHDHLCYPMVDKKGMSVIRPGSLSRGTKAVSSVYKDVCYGVLTFSESGFNYLQEKVPVASADEVFSLEESKKDVMDSKIVDFVKTLDSNKMVGGDFNIDGLLKSFCDDKKLYDYVKNYFINFGLV
jgi:exonuclease SbcD